MARSLHLPHVRMTCASRHNIRVETQLLCWCALLESAWWPVRDLRWLPGGWLGAGVLTVLARIWIRTFGQGQRGAGAGQTRNGGCAAPNKEGASRTANKTAAVTVLAEIDLNPASI